MQVDDDDAGVLGFSNMNVVPLMSSGARGEVVPMPMALALPLFTATGSDDVTVLPSSDNAEFPSVPEPVVTGIIFVLRFPVIPLTPGGPEGPGGPGGPGAPALCLSRLGCAA